MAYRDTPPFDPFEVALPARDVTVAGFCCIEFPTSLIPYVTGALEGLTYPAAWEGSDSDVVRAIQIFQTLIAELGTMITACKEQTTPTFTGGCGDMSSNCNPCLPLRIENGVLQMFNCGAWVDVGSVGSANKADVNDDFPPPDEWVVEPVEGIEPDFACVKATAAVGLVCDVLNATAHTWNDLKPIKNTEDEVGYDLKDQYLVLMFAEWLKVSIVDEATFGAFSAEVETFTSAQNKQKMVCELTPRMDPDTGRFTEDDWQATKRYFWGEADRAIMAEFLVTYACMAVGKGNIDRAFIENANGDFDCACPEIETIPVPYTWKLEMDLKLGNYGTTRNAAQNQCQYVPGEGWVIAALDGGGANVPMFGRNSNHDAPEPCQITYVKVHVKSWPNAIVPGGGTPSFFKNGAIFVPGTIGSQFRGLENMSAIVNTSHTVGVRLEWGWDEWFNGTGNETYRAVVDKVVIAGTGGDMWSGLQPDGTWLDQ